MIVTFVKVQAKRKENTFDITSEKNIFTFLTGQKNTGNYCQPFNKMTIHTV